MIFAIFITVALVVSGCGKNDKENNAVDAAKNSEEQDKDNHEKDKNEEETEKEDTANQNEETNRQTETANFAEIIAQMEKTTEGTAKVLFENDKPQVHEMDGVSVSLDAYTVVELKNFHTNFQIPFGDQTDGGVLLAQYTVKNELDKDVYYQPFLDLSYTGATKSFSNYKDLFPEDVQLPEKLGPSNDYALKAGETVTGYYVYPFGEDVLQDVLNLGTVAIDIPAAREDLDDFNSKIGKDAKFNISVTKEGADKVASNEVFYQDKATVDNMGDKTMLKEKQGIDESHKLEDVTVTLDGYQFTEFTPNEVEAPRFSNFENGIVLLTIKLNIDNKSSSEIGQSSISSKLTVNNGAQYMLSEGMLLNYKYSDVIEAGKSGELLQLFVLDKEQYDKIWKDKTFEFEIGPMRDKEAKDISKGKKATFELPM